VDVGPMTVIYSDTKVKLTNVNVPDIAADAVVSVDIDFSKMEVSCLMENAPTLCTGEAYSNHNPKFKDAFEPIKTTVSGKAFVLESEFGTLPYLVIFSTSAGSMDFKLYTL